MKKLILILLGVLFISCTQDKPANEGDIRLSKETFDSFASKVKLGSDLPATLENKIQNGDIIFQISLSPQSRAIQLATDSKYSHCGLIFKNETNKKWYVLEAVQPVKYTLLSDWISKGSDEHYVIKRFATDPPLPEGMLRELKENADKYLGKDYDLTFEWSDKKIYCSELVFKAYYETTGLEIGKLQKLKDFILENETVKSKLAERYGNKIPMNETVISPQSLFEDSDLITIGEN